MDENFRLMNRDTRIDVKKDSLRDAYKVGIA